MATQNIIPSSGVSSRKGGACANTGQGDGQSVSKRLQQDLMTLMVSSWFYYFQQARVNLDGVIEVGNAVGQYNLFFCVLW